MKKIFGYITKSSDISEMEKKRFYELLNQNFDNVNEDKVYSDLDNSDYIIILKDGEKIVGFSTQTILSDKIDGKEIKAIFSGDTIIQEGYWGQRELPRVWGRFALSLKKKYPHIDIYWLLISKGYMTYLLLPRYFKKFYPRYNCNIPDSEKRIMDKFLLIRFPEEYDKKEGLVNIKHNYYLKRNMGHPTEELLKDENINFFIKKNPLYCKGVELACIVKIDTNNMQNDFIKLIEVDSIDSNPTI